VVNAGLVSARHPDVSLADMGAGGEDWRGKWGIGRWHSMRQGAIRGYSARTSPVNPSQGSLVSTARQRRGVRSPARRAATQREQKRLTGVEGSVRAHGRSKSNPMAQEIELKLEIQRSIIGKVAELPWLRKLAKGPTKREKLVTV
jgi:hypothetical protein